MLYLFLILIFFVVHKIILKLRDFFFKIGLLTIHIKYLENVLGSVNLRKIYS
jgi:hypothetical protein